MTPKRRLFFNPKAGPVLWRDAPLWLAKKMDLAPSQVLATIGIFEFEREVDRAVQDGVSQIIAWGGDGTVNVLVQALSKFPENIRRGVQVAIAPGGTGSDYFRAIAMRSKTDRWIQLAQKGESCLVDFGQIAFASDKNPSRVFVNHASVGLPPLVVARKNGLPRVLPGQIRYLLPTLAEAVRYKPKPMRVDFDGGSVEERFLAVFISKGQFAGGGMRIAHSVRLDDGLFEVTMIRDLGLLRISRNLHHLYDGNLHLVPGVTKHLTEHVEITSDEPLPLEFDGECYGGTPVRFSIARHQLNLCTR